MEQKLNIDEYRERLIDIFHETGHDEFISLVALPTEEELRILKYSLTVSERSE